MVGLRTHHSLRCNPFPGSKNELAKGLLRAFINDSDTFTPIPAMLRAFTPTLAPPPPSANELFKQFMKVYLKAKIQPTQPKP